MSKKISGAEYPLSKIFSSDFDYVIPSYQRPYAWTEDESSELFDDLYEFYTKEPDEGYFLGSIVLIKGEGNPYSEVIDGQQRLTTLTILLAAIASFLEGEDRQTLCKYIMEPGNKYEELQPKPRLALRERDRGFFSNYVQDLKFGDLLALSQQSLKNESQNNIQKNSKLILERIGKHFSNGCDKLQGFVGFLLQRCFLVAVSTPNQQSAFRVFSVMNSRGLDLQSTDIIKADLIGGIQSEEKRDEYNERWEDMEVELGRGGFNDLFVYVRMIYAKEKAKRALLEEFRSQVLAQIAEPQILICDVLEPHAEALNILREASYHSDQDASQINNYLRWLNRIENSDWVPPAMLFLSRHENNPNALTDFFVKLERLAACMQVCGRNVNQRIERYAQIMTALEQQKPPVFCLDSLELTTQEKQDMLEAINGDVYWIAARRRNYLILRLDSFISDGAASYDSNVLTIEHVLPQTVAENSQWELDWPDVEAREKWTHKLANLVPLNKRRNSKAQNYDFKVKKDAYFRGRNHVSSYALTSQVLNEEAWTPEVVAQRQDELLQVLIDNWNLATE